MSLRSQTQELGMRYVQTLIEYIWIICNCQRWVFLKQDVHCTRVTWKINYTKNSFKILRFWDFEHCGQFWYFEILDNLNILVTKLYFKLFVVQQCSKYINNEVIPKCSKSQISKIVHNVQNLKIYKLYTLFKISKSPKCLQCLKKKATKMSEEFWKTVHNVLNLKISKSNNFLKFWHFGQKYI